MDHRSHQLVKDVPWSETMANYHIWTPCKRTTLIALKEHRNVFLFCEQSLEMYKQLVAFTMQVSAVVINNMAELSHDNNQEIAFFVGCMYQEYVEILTLSGGTLTSFAATGSSLSFMAGR